MGGKKLLESQRQLGKALLLKPGIKSSNGSQHEESLATLGREHTFRTGLHCSLNSVVHRAS